MVVWRRHGSFVQIMDPAAGRRWVSGRRFPKTVFRHTQAIPADAWLDWAKTEEFRGAMLRRMRRLGFIPPTYWSLRADPQTGQQVLFSAAVLIHARGRRAVKALPENVELQAALKEAPARPGLELARLVPRDSRLAPGLAAAALALATAGTLIATTLMVVAHP